MNMYEPSHAYNIIDWHGCLQEKAGWDLGPVSMWRNCFISIKNHISKITEICGKKEYVSSMSERMHMASYEIK